jgi:hypothetical protein
MKLFVSPAEIYPIFVDLSHDLAWIKTCVSLWRTQKPRLSRLLSLLLYASLGVDPEM